MNLTSAIEPIAFVAVSGLAVGLTLAMTRDAPSRKAVLASVVAVIAVAAVVAVAWQRHRDAAEALAATVDAARPLVAERDDYVTSDACRACHPEAYDSWYQSYHRTMTQVATAGSTAVPFQGQTLTLGGHRYQLRTSGQELLVDVTRLDPIGRAVSELPETKRVAFTTGSHHQQVFWYATGSGRELEMFDFTYRIDEGTWMPQTSLFVIPPGHVQGTTGLWNTVCSRCHTTRIIPGTAGPGPADTHVGELGIACESCHGPGAKHVAANRDPRRRYQLHGDDAGDPTIVLPTRLSHAASAEVCGQCHSSFDFGSEAEWIGFQKSGFAYRPGDELRRTRRLRECQPALGTWVDDCKGQFFADGVLRVTGREYHGVVNSPCYKGGEFSCTSCHSMHQRTSDSRPPREWADDQLKFGRNDNAACDGCHAPIAESLAAHTHHEVGSSGSLCYNCHMPNTTTGVQQATRSHTITNPSVVDNLKGGRPNACNLCHLDQSLGWTADNLEAWYGAERPALTEEQESIAAAASWLLTGDAGLRAIAAWHLGWEPARAISGTAWMTPYLAQLLDDPYDIVRFIAGRSLRKDPAYSDFEYDFTAPGGRRFVAQERAMTTWEANATGEREPRLLIAGPGKVDRAAFAALLSRRDDSPVWLFE